MNIKELIEEYKNCLYFDANRYRSALSDDCAAICDIGTDFATQGNYINAVACWSFIERIGKADANTYCNLGVSYYYGNGIEKNTEKAIHYYQHAASMGHAWGQYNYAVALENGIGIQKDIEKAIQFYYKAAEQHINFAIDALIRLGVYDEIKLQWFQRDISECI